MRRLTRFAPLGFGHLRAHTVGQLGGRPVLEQISGLDPSSSFGESSVFSKGHDIRGDELMLDIGRAGPEPALTAIDVTDMLLTNLSEATRRDRQHWGKVLGGLRHHALATHSRCNWQFKPSGAETDIDVAEQAIEIVQAEHPYIR